MTPPQLRAKIPHFIRFESHAGLFRGYQASAAAIFGLIALQVILAYVLGSSIFHTGWGDVFGLIRDKKTLAGWLLIPLLWIGAVTIAITRRHLERPARVLVRWLRFRADWLIRGFLIISAYPTMANAFSINKAAIPKIVGFYADPFLIKVDRTILLGHDAWQVSHAVFPTSFLFFIDRLYILWFTYMIILTSVFSFTQNIRLQMQGALSFFLSWLLLGLGLATALSSAGPVFYDSLYHSNYFGGLIDALHRADADGGLVATLVIEFLIRNADTPELGIGISAMPSMHVAIASLGFLMALQYEGKRWLKLFTLAFTILILVGSVHLGWHYLIDGIVSILSTIFIWFVVGKFVDWSYRPSDCTLTR